MSSRKTVFIYLTTAFVTLLCHELSAQLAAPILPAPTPARIEFETNKALELKNVSRQGALSLILRESFLNQLLAEQRTDTGPVRDFILGADVVGTQRTVSRTSVDLLPNEKAASLLFRLNGTTQNQTTSYTPQAAIKNCGQYRFELTKRVQFDGNVVSTWSPAAFLNVSQKNIGVETPLTPLPLFGRIAEQTAMNIANRNLPEVQQIAAYKVTRQVAPKFNVEVDEGIAQVNRKLLPDLQFWLKKYNLADLSFAGKTTDSELVVTSSTGSSVASTQLSPQLINPASSGGVIVNDGFLNYLLQRFPLAGRRIPDTDLETLLINPSLNLRGNGKPKLFTIILDDTNPLSLAFQNGALELEARLSVEPVLGKSLGSHLFRFRITADIIGDSVRFEAKAVEVLALQKQAGDSEVLSSELIVSEINERLKPMTLPGIFPAQFLSHHPDASLQLLEILEQSGELKIEYQIKLSNE